MRIESHLAKRMRCRYAALALALILGASACKSNTQPEGPAKTPVPAQVEPTPASEPAEAAALAEPAIKSALAAEMPYATLRKTLLNAGWLPLRDPLCWENVGGSADVCYRLPEVEGCSGDGRCTMRFASEKDGAILRVTTYGDYRRWNRRGEETALSVKSFSFAPVKSVAATTSAAPACPARDFDAFLKAFASDPAVERSFTAPLVSVAEIGGGDDGDDAVPVYMLGADYIGFNVEYSDNAFHFVSDKGQRDSSALELKVDERDRDVYGVRYLYGMSEGNSYTFESADGCWYLTEDPEPPSP